MPAFNSDRGSYAALAARRGSETKLCASALNFAFRDLGLRKVCRQAFGRNDASIRLHPGLGFFPQRTLYKQHRVGPTYHDLICYGISRRESL